MTAPGLTITQINLHYIKSASPVLHRGITVRHAGISLIHEPYSEFGHPALVHSRALRPAPTTGQREKEDLRKSEKKPVGVLRSAAVQDKRIRFQLVRDTIRTLGRRVDFSYRDLKVAKSRAFILAKLFSVVPLPELCSRDLMVIVTDLIF